MKECDKIINCIIVFLCLGLSLTGCSSSPANTSSITDQQMASLPQYAEALSQHIFSSKEELHSAMDWTDASTTVLSDQGFYEDLSETIKYLSNNYTLRVDYNYWNQNTLEFIRKNFADVDTENLFLGEENVKYFDNFLYTTTFTGESAIQDCVAAANEVIAAYSDIYGTPVKDRFTEEIPEAVLKDCYDHNQRQLAAYVVWDLTPDDYPQGVYYNVRVGVRNVTDSEAGKSCAVSLTIEYAVSMRKNDI